VTATTTRTWRKRQCPACRHVAPAGEFELVSDFGAYWDRNGDRAERACPDCGHTAVTEEFRVVADRRPRPKPARTPTISRSTTPESLSDAVTAYHDRIGQHHPYKEVCQRCHPQSRPTTAGGNFPHHLWKYTCHRCHEDAEQDALEIIDSKRVHRTACPPTNQPVPRLVQPTIGGLQ
jgi:hypothetical protein